MNSKNQKMNEWLKAVSNHQYCQVPRLCNVKRDATTVCSLVKMTSTFHFSCRKFYSHRNVLLFSICFLNSHNYDFISTM